MKYPFAVSALSLVLASSLASAQSGPLKVGFIYTYAGAANGIDIGDGGPAIDADFFNPNDAVPDAAGNLYIADWGNARIRKVDALTGIVSTVAGNGVEGYGGDGGPATAAALDAPMSVAFDAHGNMYISDFGNQRVRKVDALTGIISTVAGTGNPGSTGDGGPATDAELYGPYMVAIDAAGDFYIQTSFASTIRKVTVATGVITTIAGNPNVVPTFSGDGGPAVDALLNFPYGMAFDAAGNLYIADTSNNRIRKIDAATGIINTVAGNGAEGFVGDGGPALNAEFHSVTGIRFDASGDLYIADANNNRIRVVNSTSGVITTIAGDGVAGFSGDGGPAIDAEMSFPSGVSVNAAGNVFITDNNNGRIRIVQPEIVVSTTTALTAVPASLTVGQMLTLTATVTAASGTTPTGTVIFYNGTVSLGSAALNSSGVATLVLPPAAGAYSITANYTGSSSDGPSISAPPSAVTVNGPMTGTTTTVSASPANTDVGQTMTLTATVTPAGGGTPTGTVTFLNGAIAIGSTSLNANGVATLLVTFPVGNYSIAASYGGDANNTGSVSAALAVQVVSPDIYTYAGNGIQGSAGDGGLATSAELFEPSDAILDAAGDVYIADQINSRIQKVDAVTGIVSTVAGHGLQGFSGDGGPATSAQLNLPSGLAFDAAGNLYIADWANSRIRKVDAHTGIITSYVSNQTTQSVIEDPWSIAFDSSGDLYYSDTGNDYIRKVEAGTGNRTIVAGTGTRGYSGDGGPAAQAEINFPYGIALDSAGNLYFADTYNNRIRKVEASTGIITTVAGDGVEGYSGDGGPAIAAELAGAWGVGFDNSGNLLIADAINNRIRLVNSVTGVINTIAGNGIENFSGDGGPAIDAELSDPVSIAVDVKGNIYISDTDNSRIRIVGQNPEYGVTSIATTTTLAVSAMSLTVGQTLTLTATVTAASGATPTGTVTFLNGTTTLGTGSLNSNGVATLVLNPGAGVYSITASYGGSTTDAASASSPPITVTVIAAGTTTNLTAAPASLSFGQTLTLTATVTAAIGAVPAGTVTFLNGTVVLGTASLNGNGVATLTLTPAAGAYSITASYGGSSADGLSVSSPPVSVTVIAAATTVVATSSLNPAPFGASVTFTATVASPAGTPGGSVSFYDGTTLLGTSTLASGAATFATSGLSVGSHPITAVYGGAANFAPSTSTALTQVIAPATFSISAAPGSQSLYTGQAASYTVTITPGQGFNLPVALSCSQLPANTTVGFSSATVSGGTWTSTLVVQTSAPAPPASASVTPGRAGVIGLAGLLLVFLPRRLRRSRGWWPMLFVVLALFAAITACGGPSSLSGGTPTGSQSLTVTGMATNGSQTLTQTTTVTLNVQSLF